MSRMTASWIAISVMVIALMLMAYSFRRFFIERERLRSKTERLSKVDEDRMPEIRSLVKRGLPIDNANEAELMLHAFERSLPVARFINAMTMVAVLVLGAWLTFGLATHSTPIVATMASGVAFLAVLSAFAYWRRRPISRSVKATRTLHSTMLEK